MKKHITIPENDTGPLMRKCIALLLQYLELIKYTIGSEVIQIPSHFEIKMLTKNNASKNPRLNRHSRDRNAIRIYHLYQHEISKEGTGSTNT